ncbi:MAG: O-antigen ligase family protein [Solirubrobacterales bacterium]
MNPQAHPLMRALEGVSRAMLVGPAAGLLGLALFSLLYLYPPPAMPAAVAGGIFLAGILALAIVRYEWAAALGFSLLAVVMVEPAPPDVVFAIVIALALVTGRFYLSAVPMPILALLIGFLALNLISVVEVIEPGRAVVFLAITIYLVAFGIWVAGFVRAASRARLVLLAYLLAAVTSAALGSLALLVPYPGSEIFLLDGCCRAKGLFQDSNVYGPFLIPAALILLQETIEPRLVRLARPWKLLLLVILMTGVMLSFSRGAWINLAVGLLVMVLVLVLRRGGAKRGIAVLAVVATAIGAVAVVVVAGGSLDFLQQRTGVQSYDVERIGAQRTGVELASEHPFGVGPGQFEELSPVATHSTYVRVLAEQGVLGFFGFLAVMLATLLFAVRNAARGISTYGIGSAALLAAWCGLLVNSLAVDTLHWRHLWLVAALIWVAAMRPASRRSP